MKLPLERFVLGGVAVVLVAVVGVGATALHDADATTQSAKWIARSVQMREYLNLTAGVVSDAESGALGYGLTRDTTYGALYRASSAHAASLIEQIRSLAADNPGQRARTDSLAELVSGELALLQRMIALRPARAPATAVNGVARDDISGMNRIRALVTRMNVEETRRHDARVATLDDDAHRARLDVWLGMLITIAIALVAALLTGRQLRERRRADLDAAEHYRKLGELSDLLDHSHVILRDIEGRIRLWPSVAEQVYGWSKAEAVGQVTHELLRTEFPAPLSAINRELETSGHWEGILRHRKRDGHFVVKQSQWILHRDAAGATSVLEINRDITEQRRAEELFRVAVEGSPSGLVMVDHDGQIVLVNREIERLFGYSRDQLVGRHVEMLLPDGMREGHPALRDQFALDPHARAMGAGRELFGRRSDGGQVPVEIGLNPIAIDGADLVLASVVDITARKRSEFDLKRSNEELERFAYVASHDLQEPLRMVASYVQLLGKRYKGKLDADADEFIAYAADGAVRMQRLIEDLLAFSRIGTRGAALQTTDTNAVLAGAMANLKLAIEESGAVITTGSLPTVAGDAGQLGHLFLNLLSNALKFRCDEPPRVDVSATRQDDEWLFRVQDNGIGIDNEYFERIFVIFQRLHGRERYSGNGIGLSIARKIVERHGGRMWVESEAGRGTTFLFTLPVAKES